jgi:protocatechuate 3,4-dioxygenase beta subunit
MLSADGDASHEGLRRMTSGPTLNRRQVLGRAGVVGTVALAAAVDPALAAWLEATPAQPAGPFYAPFKPLAIDNDLVLMPGKATPAEGRILHLMGRVRDQLGRAVRGARVEIWQANKYGRYNHPRHANANLRLDPNFQGFGHDLTDDRGGYRFRTIKPGPYPDNPTWLRPPHIHFAVFAPGDKPWTTQMYFAGETLNDHDLLLKGIQEASDRARLIVEERPPTPDLEPGSRLLSFDIVLGMPGVSKGQT